MGFSVCRILAYSWDTRADYSFGYIAPLFILFVLYDRKDKIFGYYNSPAKAEGSSKIKNFFAKSELTYANHFKLTLFLI